jgi:hypothetical protein
MLLALAICSVGPLLPRAGRAWEVELLGGTQAERDARAPLVLQVQGAPAETLGRLLVELDRIDITAFVQLDADRISASFAAPLAAGPHELRLLESTPQGGVEERGVWVIQVAERETLEVDSARAQLGATGSARVADDAHGSEPDILQSNGGFDGAISLSRGALALDANGAGYYDTVEENLGGNEADIGAFLVEARHRNATLRYGHYALQPTSLLIYDFDRRGLSGGLGAPSLRTRLDAFVVKGSPVIGARGGFGLEDPDDRVAGLVLQSRPLEGKLGAIDLSGVLVDGSAPVAGTELSGVSGDPVESDGRAWSARLDGQLADRRLEIFGEYARGRFDPDGSGATRAETDDARWVGLNLAPFPELAWRGQPVVLELRVEESAIGTWFRSPANPSAPQDRHIQSALLHVARAGLDLQGSLAREEDNVDGVDELPRMRSDLFWVDASYTPLGWSGDAAPRLVRWIGQPTLRGYYSREDLAASRIPAVLDAQAVTQGVNSLLPDQVVQTGYAGLAFSKQSVSWQVGERVIDTDSASDSFPSTRIYQTELAGSAFFASRFTLGPYLSYDETSSEDLPRTRALLLGGQVGAALLPETLGLRFDGSYSRTWSSRGTGFADGHTITTSGALDWTALAVAPRRPGLLLSLLGTWQEQQLDALPGPSSHLYQIFLQGTISWARQWGT